MPHSQHGIEEVGGAKEHTTLSKIVFQTLCQLSSRFVILFCHALLDIL
jgi:hypothetical protein